MGGMTSCLKNKPESFPENLEWNPSLAFPVGTDRYGLNAESGFDTTLFELDTITELPKWVGLIEVVMQGRIDFDLSAYESNLDNTNRILFRVGLFNGFPNEVSAQAYFIDADERLIDSMFSEGAIPLQAGTPTGDTIEPRKFIKDAVFTKERLNNLLDATEIILRAVIRNPEIDTILIPYYPYYYLDMEIGMMTDLSLEF